MSKGKTLLEGCWDPRIQGLWGTLQLARAPGPWGAPSHKPGWEPGSGRAGSLLEVLMCTHSADLLPDFIWAGAWAGCFGMTKTNQSWIPPPYFPL